MKELTILDVLNAANDGYQDGYLSEYYDEETGELKEGQGDTLAEFIVKEIHDTFDPKSEDHFLVAVHTLEIAIKDLQDVISALENSSND